MVLIWVALMIGVEHFLNISIGHMYVFFREVSMQMLFPFFDWVLCLHAVDLYMFFIYFGN